MNQKNAVTPWYLYLIETKDKKLYCGITLDVARRFQEHCKQNKKTAKALRGKAPLTLVYSVALENKSQALKLEYKVKRLPKAKKHQLISNNLEIHALL